MDTWNRAAQIGMIVTGIVAGLAALNAAEGIFAPLTLALVVGIVLSPISDFWENRGFPPALGALSSLLLTLTVFGLLILMIQPVAAELMAAAPKVWADMQGTVNLIKGFLRGLAKVNCVVRLYVLAHNLMRMAVLAPQWIGWGMGAKSISSQSA